MKKVNFLITTITPPYPDEIFYSWFGRSHLLSGNIYSSQTDFDFFLGKNHNKSIYYPSNLNYFCSQLPTSFNISTGMIISDNTCFPFFKPFLKKSFSNYIVEIMRYGATTPKKNIKKICNLFEDRLIKICNQCIIEDKKNYGIAYIHRLHQIPGCFICPNHHIPLEYIDLSNTKYSTNYFILDNFINNKIPFKIDFKIYEELFKLQSDINNFLKFDIGDYTIEKVIAKYKQKLISKGYSTLKGTIKYEKLADDFLNFYTQDLLDFLKCNINIDTTHNSLCNLIRNVATKFNPIKHLLFIKFLFGGVENFINAPEEFLPFGTGPWPCLNSASNHYKEDMITSYKLRKSTADNSIYGIFECKCGFVYTRTIPEQGGGDNKYNIKTVINWGKDWEIKATNLITSENYSLNELRLILGCSNGKIVSHAIKNKLLHHINTKAKYRDIKNKFKDNENLLEQYKQMLTQFISEHKYMSRKEISNVLHQECETVLKNDREWYDSTMPPKLAPYNNNNYVDWHKRDLEKSKLVQIAIMEIKENTDLRLTKQNISNKAGITCILESRPQSKMPITKKIIEDSQETREEYLKRKLNYLIRNSYNNGDIPTPKMIISKLHLSKKIDESLYDFVEKSIKKYSPT
jgi:hypothetical protein